IASHVSWWLGRAFAGSVTLERRVGNGTWGNLAALSPDGLGYVRHDDGTAATGTTYGYRLRITTATATSYSDEVQLSVHLALTLIRADADSTGAHLSWRLGGGFAGNATLERRVGSGTWGELAALNPAGGTASYDDSTAAVGSTYGYRLRAVTATSTNISNEVR